MTMPPPHQRPEPPRYRHAEAFCLMTYQADGGGETEIIWNSRDGVTPFVITLRSGQTASHVNWQHDERTREDYTPPAGQRYFADLTEARARQHAARALDSWAADPRWAEEMRHVYGEARDAAVAQLAAQYLSQPGAPDLIDPADPG